MKEIKLSNELIPHRDFHKGYWYTSPNLDWYYFKKENRVDEIPTNKSFYNSVDKDLRSLTKFLHSEDIITTPSCSGHIYSKNYFEGIYDKLEKDSYIIKEEGLEVENIETGQKFLFKDFDYSLPYSKDEFIDSAIEYTKNGVIGINNLPERILKALDKIQTKKLRSTTDNGLCLIHTHGESTEEIKKVWSLVTYLLKRLYYL